MDNITGDRMQGQKFARGERVKVADKMPREKSHFQSGCEAIIVNSYSQLYDGSDGGEKQYALILLDDEGNVDGSSAWYGEELLTLVNDEVETGLRILNEHRFNSR